MLLQNLLAFTTTICTIYLLFPIKLLPMRISKIDSIKTNTQRGNTIASIMPSPKATIVIGKINNNFPQRITSHPFAFCIVCRAFFSCYIPKLYKAKSSNTSPEIKLAILSLMKLIFLPKKLPKHIKNKLI